MDDELTVDIRPMGIDQLATFDAVALRARKERIDYLLTVFTARCTSLHATLQKMVATKTFLEEEQQRAVVALKLQAGDVVRVVCPECKGSGLKPMDVTTGRIQTTSAFETLKGPVPVKDPRLCCSMCEGHKWVLMDRYRG